MNFPPQLEARVFLYFTINTYHPSMGDTSLRYCALPDPSETAGCVSSAFSVIHHINPDKPIGVMRPAYESHCGKFTSPGSRHFTYRHGFLFTIRWGVFKTGTLDRLSLSLHWNLGPIWTFSVRESERTVQTLCVAYTHMGCYCDLH